MILVAAPPACGKNYVSDLIGKAMGQISYFDKDDLSVLLRRSFELCGENIDMDGKFYLQNLRSAEYDTLFKLAFSALLYSNAVLINAPLLKEVHDAEYMSALKKKANEQGARLVVGWVTASKEVCYARMKERGSDRDTLKLASWEEYAQKTDYSAPHALETAGAVDTLFVFDNENNETAAESLEKFLNTIGE